MRKSPIGNKYTLYSSGRSVPFEREHLDTIEDQHLIMRNDKKHLPVPRCIQSKVPKILNQKVSVSSKPGAWASGS